MPKVDYRSVPATKQAADLLLVPIFEGAELGPGAKEVGAAYGRKVQTLLRDNGVTGKSGETFLLPAVGELKAKSVLFVGLGKKSEVDPDTVRRSAGKVAARAARYATVASTLPQAVGRSWEPAIQAFVEGMLLGSYRFDRYKAKDEDPPKLRAITVIGSPSWDERKAKGAVSRGEVLAEATAWARDLVNTPAIDATPDFLAREARKMAKETGLTCKVWSKADLEKGRFGGILGVGQGSANPPRLIELSYGGRSGPPIALTGKGITFDSGGLSIKDAKGMESMKSDMAGAAAVLGAMRAIARLKPKVNVIAAIPSAENMPGGSAIRPGDVLRHRGGKTSEVLNTDAEGRLVLADALAYLSEKKPKVIVDAATLTGAALVALGEDLWGLFGTDREVIADLLEAGEEAGEPGWELPLRAQYRQHIESAVADVKNVGNRWGGAITAALFLKEFVGDTPWAHLDIAGPAFADTPGDYWPKGGTGVPVRTLVGFVERQATKSIH
ncbi:MAG: leucyl aminopeptidase [Actinomycetota bacterium]